MSSEDEGPAERRTKGAEDALGRLAQDLLDSPIVTGALSRAFDARERAVHAQEAALSAMNLPTAADLERLTRRVRSLSQRLEGIEDGVDRVDERMARMGGSASDESERRLAHMEAQLDKLTADVAAIRDALGAPGPQVPRDQERLSVSGD